MRRALIAGTGLSCGLLLASCRTVSLCEYDFERCGELEITADREKIRLYQSSDNSLKVSFGNRFSDVAIDCFLEPEDHSSSPRRVATLTPADSGFWQEIIFTRADLQILALGRYTLLCQEVDMARRPARLQNILLRRLTVNYESPMLSSYAGSAYEIPIAKQIGFVGNAVIAVNAGLDNNSNEVKQVRIYHYDIANNKLNNTAPAGYFAFPFPKETFAGFSQSNLFLLNQTVDSLLLRRCTGVTPASVADCPPVDANMKMMIQAEKALVVTPDGTRVVRADPGGNLKQAATQAPLKWEAVATTAMFSAAATVKVASGDLDADGKADLAAIWQDGSSQQVRVFLGKDGGFGDDPVWTQRLQTGLGSGRVTALAVGDVDADGCADVVVGRGLELAVLQNQQNRFVKVWSQMINPPLVTEISAVAVGRLAGSDPNQNLDIVAASNTPYDNSMPRVSTLYLHAFRPQ